MIFPKEPTVYVVTPTKPLPSPSNTHAQVWQWPPLTHVNKTNIMLAAKTVFVLPDYFGDNWDALYDALTEQSWCPYAPNLWVISLTEAEEINWDDIETFFSICQDACTYLSEQAIDLYVQIMVTEAQQAYLSDYPLWP